MIDNSSTKKKMHTLDVHNKKPKLRRLTINTVLLLVLYVKNRVLISLSDRPTPSLIKQNFLTYRWKNMPLVMVNLLYILSCNE